MYTQNAALTYVQNAASLASPVSESLFPVPHPGGEAPAESTAPEGGAGFTRDEGKVWNPLERGEHRDHL